MLNHEEVCEDEFWWRALDKAPGSPLEQFHLHLVDAKSEAVQGDAPENLQITLITLNH